jgi:hypothetical protein
MDLTDIKEILEDYPLDVFTRPIKVISINEKQLLTDINGEFAEVTKEYFRSLSGLITRRDYYARNAVTSVRDWLANLMEAANALRNMVQLCEDMSKIFVGHINWARALAVRSMIEILDSMVQQLAILRNEVRGTRFIHRIREKTFFVICQKIPQIFNILATMIAIQRGESASSEIVSAIGRGISMSQIC